MSRVSETLLDYADPSKRTPKMKKALTRSVVGATSFLALAITAACSTETPPAPFKFVEATIEDVHAALANGKSTCVDIVKGYLQRIEEFDQSSGLNAIIFTNPNALKVAQSIDTRLAANETLGSLHCVPVLLKDNYDTADMPTSGGSIALKESIPPDDAFMVSQLRTADAIIVAKTNMAEWAFSPRVSISSSYGTTANAYALDRVPAGSSGGTASATAASFGVIGMGSDTGNSIRGPSSHLALFGIRSTIGLTSRDGVIPLSFDRDIAGPMTRTVTDGAKAFNVVSGYDPADSYTEAGKDHHESDYTAFLDASGLLGKRIGVLEALVTTEDADPEVTSVFEQAVVDLEKAGAVIVRDFAIDDFAAHLEGDYFCARFRYDMSQYLSSLGDEAPITDVIEVLDTGQYSAYAKESLEFFAGYPADEHPADREPACPDFAVHEGRQKFLADTVRAMDSATVDAIIYPSWTNPPALLATGIEDYKGDNSQLLAPATGMPAITVPMGYTQGNLPAGLQILGRPYAEGLLFGLAFSYEQATLHRVPPANFSEL
jgi:amidase